MISELAATFGKGAGRANYLPYYFGVNMSIKNGIQRMWQEQKLSLAKRSLERKVSQIIELSLAHKDAGTPSGDLAYKTLCYKAEEEIGVFCQTYKVQPSDVLIGMPAFRELQALANGAVSETISEKAAKGMAAVLVLSFVLTVVIAVDHNIYLGLTHWCNVHWSAK